MGILNKKNWSFLVQKMGSFNPFWYKKLEIPKFLTQNMLVFFKGGASNFWYSSAIKNQIKSNQLKSINQ